MSLAAGLPCVPTFRVPSSQVRMVMLIRMMVMGMMGVDDCFSD